MASEAVVARLEAVASRLEALAGRIGKGGASAGDEKTHPSVEAYRDFYENSVKPFSATCRKIGQNKIADQTEAAFNHCLVVVEAAAVCKQPAPGDFKEFVKPIVQVVNDAQNTDNRDAYFNHQKAFAELIQLMNWIMLPGPVQIVLATLEASEFYLNKVLVFAKDKPDPEKQNNRDYVTQSKALINELAEYVKQYHKMGLAWQAQGKNLAEFKSSGSAAPAAAPARAAPAAPGGPPPPPPVPAGPLNMPPPPPVDHQLKLDTSGAAAAPAAKAPTKVGGMAAVFEEINKKKDQAASGLNHVTKEMKSKNIKDKPAPVVAPKDAPKPAAAAREVKEEKKAPAITRKQGTWFCEHWENKHDLVLEDVQMKESVYIYKCTNSFVHVKGKVKSIQLDGCFKTTVVCDSVVSTFEVVNGKRITMQVLNQCPSIVVDKTSGCQIHLTKEAMQSVPTIVTSMASEINVSVPGPDGADPVEAPVPEQFQTTFQNGKWVTEPVAHSAA